MNKDEALKLALEAYIKAGVGNSTDFVLQGKAYDLAIGALAQPEHEPWCMKMNVCKTKCEDCPDEPEQEPVTHNIDSTGAAAVATDYYWIPIDKDTPRGVKLQLFGKGGVAQYSSYHGDPFWEFWAPLPKRRD